MRSRSPAILSTVMMWRRSLAIGWRRAIMRMVCSCSSRSSWSMDAVAGDGRLGELGIALLQRVEALRQQPLGQAAHLRDLLVEQLQLLVERLDDVLVHGSSPMSAARHQTERLRWPSRLTSNWPEGRRSVFAHTPLGRAHPDVTCI